MLRGEQHCFKLKRDLQRVRWRVMLKLMSAFRISLSRAELVRVRRMAVRRGVWFKVLSRIERLQVDLTIKVVERVRSLMLARALRSILKKLFEAMESRISRLMREVGLPLARRLSVIAENWGYRYAEKWVNDPGFIKFLAVTYMNTPALFRINILSGEDD